MRHVTIVGAASHRICQSLGEAFDSLGWRSRVFTWKTLPWKPSYRLGKILGGRYERDTVEAKYFNRLLNEDVFPAISEDRPDCVLVVKPFQLEAVTLKTARALGLNTVAWAIDSLERYPGQQSFLPIAKRAYVMDGGEASPPKVPWLPLGFDDQIFHPLQEPTEFDVLFIGNISGKCYKKRRAFLKKLRSSPLCQHWRVGFVGAAGSRFESLVGKMPGRIEWVAPSVSLETLARLVARSRVCINIHQDDGEMPVNPMFFAIPGCGTCQIVDDRKYFNEWMQSGKEYIPVNEGNFLARIEELLKNDGYREEIIDAGYRAALRHTFVSRVRQILSDIGIIS